MNDQATRTALARHWSDINDQDVVHEIYHDDVVVEFPQSGERIQGRANLRAMREVYPSPLTFTIKRIRGGGDLWVIEGVITYDGKPMTSVTIMEFRDGNVAHETIYFGEPWDPPGWRAQWVEVLAGA
jgi:ketosteroid isomerase-like protein